MIVTVLEVAEDKTESGKECRRCSGTTDKGTEVTFYVNERLKEYWEQLPGMTWNVGVKKFGEKYWANSISLSDEAVEAHPESKEKTEGEKPPISREEGQAVGRCWNDIRELFIHEKLDTLFGKDNAREIAKQYRGYLLGTLRLHHDGAKLPQWEDKS